MKSSDEIVIIMLRSRLDRCFDGGDSMTNDARSRLDRAAIREFFHEAFEPSDGDPGDRDPHDHRGPHDSLSSA